VPQPIITLDGPAGAGKSTVGARLAARQGWLFVDTGLFYRVVALLALRRGIRLDDEDALSRLARSVRVEFEAGSSGDGPGPRVVVDGEDVTSALRDAAVDRSVSLVAALPGVRAALIEPQRAAVRGRPAVVAGRDIGTIIFPDAALKVYLDASPAERARRRAAQLAASGAGPDPAAVLRDLQRRDDIDSSRATAPLAVPDGATCLMTDGSTVEEVVEQILALWRSRGGDCG